MAKENGGHGERAHALLSPSSAKRWLTCTVSLRLAEKFPNKPSSAAEEGTLGHELGEYYLRKMLGEEGTKERLKRIQGSELYQKYFSKGLETYAKDYAAFCVEEFTALGKKAKYFIETRVSMENYAKECFGTLDFSAVNSKRLKIIDLKTGRGEVDAEENFQLFLYALGMDNVLCDNYAYEEIELIIFQPSLGAVSRSVITRDELLDWAEDFLRPNAKYAYAGGGQYKAGDHCKFCPAASGCRHLATHNLKLAKAAFKDPDIIPDEEVGPLLTQAKQLQIWVSLLESRARDILLDGLPCKGWKLVKDSPKRSIPKEKYEDIIDFLDLSGKKKEDYLKETLVPITTLEKNLGKKDFEKLLGHFVNKSEPMPLLAPESDKRKAYNPNSEAADIFKNEENQEEDE